MGKYVKTFEGFHDELYDYDYISTMIAEMTGDDPIRVYHFCALFEDYCDAFVEGMSQDDYTLALKKYIEDVETGIEPDPRDNDEYYDHE